MSTGDPTYWKWRERTTPAPPRRIPVSPGIPLTRVVADQGLTRSIGRPASADAIAPYWTSSFLSRFARVSTPSLGAMSYRDGWQVQARSIDKLLSPQTCADTWLPAIDYLAHGVSPTLSNGQLLGHSLGSHLEALAPRNTVPEHLTDIQGHAQASWKRRGLLADPELPWRTDDAYLVERLQNGMCAAKNTGRLKGGEIAWTFTTGKEVSSLPRVTVVASPGSPPKLRRISAEWSPRTEWPDGKTEEWSAAGASREQWHIAKCLVRQALLLEGQLEWHLGRCHLYAEFLLVALRLSTSEQSALHRLLWPFLRSSDEINALGDSLLLNETGFLQKALPSTTETSLNQCMHKALTTPFWPHQVPASSLAPGNSFQRWAEVTWRAVGRFVDRHIRSTPTIINDATAWRAELHSVVPEMNTSSWRSDWPVGQPEWTQEMCQHAIWTATFLHSWVGGAQFIDGGNVELAPLMLNWEPTMPADVQAACTDPKLGAAQLALAEILGRSRWGGLTDTDEPDSHPEVYGELTRCLVRTLRETPPGKGPPSRIFDIRHIKGRINV